MRGIFFLYVWPFGLPTKSTPLLVVGVKTARRKRQLLKQTVVEIYTKKYKINVHLGEEHKSPALKTNFTFLLLL